jgi:RNA polymerase sigma-70 factor (ECF subfamily)
MLEDERSLVERAKGGEAEAFGLLYDHYQPKIFRFVLLKVSHREEAEDLTHQTFLKAWENLDKYEFQGYSFGSWLYRIARNVIIDNQRRSSPKISLDEIAPGLLIEEGNEREKTDLKMELEAVAKAISRLRDIEQDVILMRFVEELSHKEVAEILGKTEGAVKLIQHRALKNLKQILNHERERADSEN